MTILITLCVMTFFVLHSILTGIANWWKKGSLRIWKEAIMYDPEHDMWFTNHPLHPNYKRNNN